MLIVQIEKPDVDGQRLVELLLELEISGLFFQLRDLGHQRLGVRAVKKSVGSNRGR
jgi:hypothetical protein